MSKLIAPAIRVGYITGPALFMESLVHLRLQIDRQGDSIMERAIADLMEDGTLRRHNKKVVAIYQQKRDLMQALLQQHFSPEDIGFEKPQGGLAFWITLRKEIHLETFVQKLLQKGVQIIPPKSFFWDGTTLPALRLGFGSLNETELEEGIIRIAKVYKTLTSGPIFLSKLDESNRP